MALQEVSGCGALLCFQPANNAHPWLSSKWVAVVHCCVSSLLTMPVLGSSGSWWLWCFAVFLACSQFLSLASQLVTVEGTSLSIHFCSLTISFRVWVNNAFYAFDQACSHHFTNLTHHWPTSMYECALFQSMLMCPFFLLQFVSTLYIFQAK